MSPSHLAHDTARALRLGDDATRADWQLVSYSMLGLVYECQCGHRQTMGRDDLIDHSPVQVFCEACEAW